MKHKAYMSIKQVVRTFREVYPDFPMPMVLVFLEVAQQDGVTVSQVQKSTGLSQASASRHCRALTKNRTAKTEGLDIAQWIDNPQDLRSQLLILNDKGKALANKLEEAIS